MKIQLLESRRLLRQYNLNHGFPTLLYPSLFMV